MADYIEKFQTQEGDLPVSYNALAHKPITRIESLDEANLANLRDLESGLYILYGYFHPFPGSPETLTYDNALASVAWLDAGSHVLVFTPLNFNFYCEEILVDDSNERGFTYSRVVAGLVDIINSVNGLDERVTALEG